MATPASHSGLGALVPDHTLASTAATRLAARGFLGASDVGRRLMPAPQIEPALESKLTPADWLRVANVLETKAADLETNDPEIAQIYRRDATRIRAQWRRN